MRRFCHALDMARTQYHALASLFMPRLVQGLRPMGIFFLLWAVMTVPAGAFFGWNNIDQWVMASAATSFFLFVSVGVPVYILARRRCADCYLALRRTMLEAGLDRSSTLEMAKGDCQRLLEAIDSRQRAEIGRANERLFAAMGASLARRERETAEIEATYPPRLAAIQAARDQALQQADAKYPPLLREMEGRYLAQSAALRETRQQALAASKAQHEREWNEMAQRWNSRRGPLRRSGGNHPQELRAVVSRLERGRRALLDAARGNAGRRPLRANQRAIGQDPRRHSRRPAAEAAGRRVHPAAALAAARPLAAVAEGGRGRPGQGRSSRCRPRCCGC